uniref:phosphomevalonate dehydratase n=1 Tax=Thermofilum pendens TaxID=2269 RepID=A0A7C3WL25_THEPE
MRLEGKPVVEGVARGELLVTREPLAFFGGVDPLTGVVLEHGHELRGRRLSGKLLVLPHSRGSTVGSYTLLRLARRGVAPSGIIAQKGDEVLVVGCIIAGIPMMLVPSLQELYELGNGRIAELRVHRDGAVLELL